MAQIQMETYYYTPEEYLALEDKAVYKSEYINGEIFAMAGGTLPHHKIAGNVLTHFNNEFRTKDCEVYNSDLKILVKPNGAFLYPDVTVLCGEPQFYKDRNDIIANPILIVEVSSPSTQNYDRNKKFELYRDIATLQDYLIIDQSRVYVEHYHKLEDNRWVLTIYYHMESVIDLPSVDITLPLSEIYHKVKFPNAE